jgi:hypothetical protein
LEPPFCGWFLLSVFGCRDDGPAKLPLAGFRAEFVKHEIPLAIKPGETVSADVTIKNTSSETWPSKPDPKGNYAVYLSYHWLDRRRQILVEGLRTPLPRDLNPGESITLKAAIRTPEKTGDYLLHLTLLQEGVGWFSEMDGGHVLISIAVK